MRKIYGLLCGAFILFCGCSTNEEMSLKDKLEVENASKINGYYKGLPVAHSFNESIEVIEKYSNFTEFLKKKSENSRSNFSGRSQNIPLRQIVEAVDNLLHEFPFITNDGTYVEKLTILKEDFPTLTDEEIMENIQTIEDYYYKNLDVRVIEELTQNSAGIRSQRSGNYGTFDCLNSKGVFKDYGGSFGSYSMAVYAFYKASDQARSYSSGAYPNLNSQDTKRDAYRHVLWSALLCRYYYTVSSKSPKLRFAEAVGNANEECGENESDGKAMDYHNNAIGRHLYDINTPYETFLGMITGLKTPSVDLLKSKTQEELNKAVYVRETTPDLTASKIQSGKFSCTTRYVERKRYICDDLPFTRNIQPIEDEDCWETYYQAYEVCDKNKVVYIIQ